MYLFVIIQILNSYLNFFFFFNDTATTEIYTTRHTLSLHDALPILLCIAMMLGGAALITLPGLRGGMIDLRGLLWAIPSPLVHSLYLAINSRLLRHYPPLVGAGGLFLGMAITFSAMALLLGLDTPSHAATWLLVLLIALGPGALTMTLFSYSVPKLGATGFAILA